MPCGSTPRLVKTSTRQQTGKEKKKQQVRIHHLQQHIQHSNVLCLPTQLKSATGLLHSAKQSFLVADNKNFFCLNLLVITSSTKTKSFTAGDNNKTKVHVETRKTTLKLRDSIKESLETKADSISTSIPRVYCRQYDKSPPVVPIHSLAAAELPIHVFPSLDNSLEGRAADRPQCQLRGSWWPGAETA